MHHGTVILIHETSLSSSSSYYRRFAVLVMDGLEVVSKVHEVDSLISGRLSRLPNLRGCGRSFLLLLLLLLLVWYLLQYLILVRGNVEFLRGLLAFEDWGDSKDLLGYSVWSLPISISRKGLALRMTCKENDSHILAFNIQSRSSSPSSGPPGPPWTLRNRLGRHSTPSSALLAASSRCRSSILVFSSVATS